jgi:hypothetical protein
MLKCYLCILLSCISIEVFAVDRLDMKGTSIIGNSELPKSLYIVPWQQADQGILAGQLVHDLLDEILVPLERERFLQQQARTGEE